MDRLDAEARHALPERSFAYIDSQGGEHMPIHDAAHVRNAAARCNQTDFESAEAKHEAARHIVAAARRSGVALWDDDTVVDAAG
ncbi:MAG: hypothetical protein E6Q64_11340 [Ottowia sp.]|nr:MAG: hypothetical protein E6Q64_11340 [Ottowia sp.]